MIIKASQRGFGQELARHLLNGHDNEHVELHALNGFMSETLPEAFAEIEATAQGTRCQKYLFSVSLSPPAEAHVSIAEFEHAIKRVSQAVGLEHQPHAIVFHEKNAGRFRITVRPSKTPWNNAAIIWHGVIVEALSPWTGAGKPIHFRAGAMSKAKR